MSSIRLSPSRRRSVPLSLRRRIQPSAGEVRLCRTLARGGAGVRAHMSRLSIAARPLLPKERSNSTAFYVTRDT